jgi:hypothetical protein
MTNEELNKIIATDVHRLKYGGLFWVDDDWNHIYQITDHKEDYAYNQRPVLTPATNVKQAFEALEKWQDCFGKCVNIERWGGEVYHVELMKQGELITETVAYTTNKSLARAICLALTVAKGHNIKE